MGQEMTTKGFVNNVVHICSLGTDCIFVLQRTIHLSFCGLGSPLFPKIDQLRLLTVHHTDFT